MTKHRSREDRVEEIMQAAMGLILEKGFATMTMDAIAARTTLSKGGVYRFFSNKKEIALALLDHLYEGYIDFEHDNPLDWGLNVEETLVKVVMSNHFDDEDGLQLDKIWLQLIAATVTDDDFKAIKQRHLKRIMEEVAILIKELFRREGKKLTPEGEDRIRLLFDVSNVLVEGLVIEHVSGIPREELEELVRFYLSRIFVDLVEQATV